MSVEKDIFTYMKTRSAITDLVGSRIYAMKLPQDATFPSIAYNRVSSVRTRSHSGDSSLTRPRIQYSCYAETYEDAKDLAEAIISEMESFSGTAGTATIYDSFVENTLDLYDSEAKLYHVPVDLMIRYNG